jgi:hypothetical protein
LTGSSLGRFGHLGLGVLLFTGFLGMITRYEILLLLTFWN